MPTSGSPVPYARPLLGTSPHPATSAMGRARAATARRVLTRGIVPYRAPRRRADTPARRSLVGPGSALDPAAAPGALAGERRTADEGEEPADPAGGDRVPGPCRGADERAVGRDEREADSEQHGPHDEEHDVAGDLAARRARGARGERRAVRRGERLAGGAAGDVLRAVPEPVGVVEGLDHVVRQAELVDELGGGVAVPLRRVEERAQARRLERLAEGGDERVVSARAARRLVEEGPRGVPVAEPLVLAGHGERPRRRGTRAQDPEGPLPGPQAAADQRLHAVLRDGRRERGVARL